MTGDSIEQIERNSGYTPVWPSILGPVFWVLATIFSTIALLTPTKGAARAFTDDNTELKYPE